MASHTWLEQFCNVELSPGKFCRKCPRCGCEHRTKPTITGAEIGMTSPADLTPTTRAKLLTTVAKIDPFEKRKPARKEWMPYRDPGMEG